MKNNNEIVTTISTTHISSNTSILTLDYKDDPAYVLFISSLKANYTKIKYDGCLQKYLKHPCNTNITSLSNILSKDPKSIENEIIQQLIEMKRENLSYSTMSVHIAALYHFFSINDITLNRKKLSKFLGEHENKYEYRNYTQEEISRLLSLCDERGKVIVLLMASTGMRVGVLPELKLKHLKRCRIDNNNHIYQIQIYASSKKYSYITFCTPECAQAIDNYLEYRKRIDKAISFDPQTDQWVSTDPNTLLISRLFDIENIPYCSTNFEKLSRKPMHVMGIRAYIVGRLKKLNLRQTWTSTENSQYMGTHKNELHPCHSFHIFAVTNMQRSKVDKTIREMLVGHATGLDSAYYKPQDEEILLEYLKAVDTLTINNENKLKTQVKELAKKNSEKEFLLNVAMMQKDKEVEDLRKQDKIKEEALVKLSDQVMILMKDMQSIKNIRTLEI